MNNFFKDFESYEGSVPPGVRLPEIIIEDRFYKKLDIDKSTSNFDFLRALCRQGVKNLGIDKLDNKQSYYDRAKSELDILEDLGFTDYILLNWDILNFCHENDIPTGPGRGSAAGSLVLYLIGVTQIDPIKYDLFFERFVSKSRARKIKGDDGFTYLDGSLLADIDNDISYEKRQDVISYIEEKYPSRTAKILTLNTLSGKLCIKECGKIVANIPEQDMNIVSEYIPKNFGKVVPLDEAYLESERFNNWVDENKKVFLIARKIEGLNKNTGVHPSGIAISFQEMSSICPLQATNDGSIVTGYDMNWVSELMVKFDILGLRTLSVIYDVCNTIGLNPKDIDVSDKKLYESLDDISSPHGLFQIEADLNFKVCKKVSPRSLEELSSVIAIGRPGAIDFLDDFVEYRTTGETQQLHSIFDKILDSTGGIPLYQEQLMKMAVEVGFSLDESEQLRRIVGKKKVEEMPKWKTKIEQKVIDNNLPHEVGELLWKVAEDSANYSFNKSHSISYATLAAWTTYLKFKHPQQFFLSLLKMTKYEPSPQEEINKVCQELPRFDIKLLPPDLARSSLDFAIEDNNLRFGLNSIKGVSSKSLEQLIKFRESDKPNKFDIFLAAKQAGLNISILCALIQAGALGGYKSNRSLLVLEAQSFNILTEREKRNVLALAEQYDYKLLNMLCDARDGKLIADDGKTLMKESRFNTFKKKYDPYRKIYDQNKNYEKFSNWYFENALLGHPYSVKLKETFPEEEGLNDSLYFNSCDKGNESRYIGVVKDSIKRVSRNGNKYLRIDLSDEYGNITGMFVNDRRNKLDRYFESGGEMPQKDDIVIVFGRKGDDVLFMSDLSIMNKKCFMKLSDLRKV